MNVLVDTGVWSLALRRRHFSLDPAALELRELIRAHPGGLAPLFVDFGSRQEISMVAPSGSRRVSGLP